MKRILGVSILLILLSVGIIGCGQGNADSSESTNSSEGKDSFKIGYSINTLNNPFFVQVKEAAEKAANEAGVDLSIINANSDLSTQMNGIEDLIQQQIDVLIIDPVDSEGSVPSVIAANEAGIPVITTGRRIEGGEVATHLGYDEVKNGETAGNYLAELIKEEGKVIELQGTTGTDVARQRSEGFQQAMNNYPNIEIVASQSADFDRAEALTVVESILQSNPDVIGLYAANDEMGLGALQAIESANIADFFIVSNDGTEEALQSVANGGLAGTMAISPDEYGLKTIETAVEIAAGKSAPEFIELPSNLINVDNVENTN